MIAVIFEAVIKDRGRYLDTAAGLRPLLDGIDGFLSVERFQSLSDPEKVLSLSFWRDEAAVTRWRSMPEHRAAQALGRSRVFSDYRLRIARVVRDYGMDQRGEVPADLRDAVPSRRDTRRGG